MKISPLLNLGVFLAVHVNLASAQGTLLFFDDFKAADSTKFTEINEDLEGRQTGTLVPQRWTNYESDYRTQIGNAGEAIGQPEGKANGDFLLLADTGKASPEELVLSSANVDGPLLISFDMFPGKNEATWTAFTLTNHVGPGWGWGASGFPQVPGSNEFGFRRLGNGTDAIIYIGGVPIRKSASS